MGISRSLNTGASSLKAHQQRFDVISNNIANASTTGFKSSRANFAEQFYQVYNVGKSPENEAKVGVSGGVDPFQFGLGVKLASTTTDMSQGIIETTNRPLDMALQGEGFFVYDASGRELYSRAGAVQQDKQGYFVDSNTGAYLKGFNLLVDAQGKTVKDADGNNQIDRKVSDLKVSSSIISAPKQTLNISVNGNLNASVPVGSERQTSINIYDNQGGTHTLNLIFQKTATANEFSYTATVDSNTIAGLAGNVTFNNDGTLNTPLNITVGAAALNTAIGPTANVFSQDVIAKLADPTNLLGGLTQFSGPNTATASEQDGYASGSLIGLSVDTSGNIMGSFTNGQSEVLGQAVIAKFTNPGGLVRQGNNFLSISPNSGLANIGTAGDTFPSTKVSGGSLEQSNVDMTTEFTNMISTQRAFEAASRIVTVSDQLLQEINAIKR